MTPKEFLKAVWPQDGFYCLATPYKIPNTTRTVYVHKTFDSIAAAAQYADENKNRFDIFFAVHTLKQEKVWNPDKENYKTGTLGAYEVRKQDNMLGAKCFFFDLDVEDGSTKKYNSQGEALAELKRFCKEARLPRPMVTSSGGGLHVYWVLEDMIPAYDWKNAAIKLRQIARHHGLKFDPMRTTDVSSVLRVAGTFNLKRKDNPRPVQVLLPCTIQTNERFLKLVDDATTRAGVVVNTAPNFFADVESNLTEEYSGPPVSMKALLTACPQLRYMAQNPAEVTEPMWYSGIGAVRYVEDPDKYVHKFSQGHPGYSREATDAKLHQLRSKNIKPTTCAKLAEVCGEERCEGCQFAGKVKSPVVAARFKDPAPAPVVQLSVGTTVLTVSIPEPPAPYIRMKDGGIGMTTKNKDGDEVSIVIYAHDLYPLRRLVNGSSEIEQQVWHVELPRGGAKDFTLDADALYDRRKFVAAMANQGIYPKSANIANLQDYMIAYISELQRLADAEAQCNHLGWTDDKNKFILPDKILCADGTVKPASLSVGAQRASVHVVKKGTAQRQVELLKFYAGPAYHPNQFYILAGLGAPIFLYTGHHGVIVNATGEAGASKSTSLYTAASFWGQPELYPINGTNNGATVRGRNERITTLANLPICVDEITNIPVKDAIDLAMSITQPGHRIRLNTDGVERNATGSYKATIMLTTANNSLHGLLSTDNAAGTAGSMRVIEIQFRQTLAHSKSQADDYIHELKENYGHVGEIFLAHVMTNQKAVEQAVRDTMRWVDEKFQIQPSERFWSAYIATVLVTNQIATQLGLLSFDHNQLLNWIAERQIPYMRGIVTEEYSSPIHSLADYLEHINSNMLIVGKTKGYGGSQLMPTKMPHGELLARYDTDVQLMWVALKPFKDWCARFGLNHRKVVEELAQAKPDAEGKMQRVVTSTNAKKVLGADTELAKAQSRTFVVNMAHKDICGAVDLTVVETAPQGLRAVK